MFVRDTYNFTARKIKMVRLANLQFSVYTLAIMINQPSSIKAADEKSVLLSTVALGK